jgi:hypothetical protein
LSTNKDTIIVLILKPSIPRDLVLDLGASGLGSGEKYSEFVTALVTGYHKLTGQDLPVHFSNEYKICCFWCLKID